MHIASGRVNPREGELDGLVVHQFQDLDPLLARAARAALPDGSCPRRARASRCSPTSSTPTTSCRTATGRRAPGSSRSSSARGGRTRIVDALGVAARPRSAPRMAIAPSGRSPTSSTRRRSRMRRSELGADRAKFHRIFWHARIDGYSARSAPTAAAGRRLGWPDDAVVCLSLRNFRPVLEPRRRSPRVRRGRTRRCRSSGSSRRAGGGWTRDEFDRLATELGVEPYMAVRDVPAPELPAVTASADFAVTLADVDSSPAVAARDDGERRPARRRPAPSMDEWIQQGEGGELVENGATSTPSRHAMLRLARDPELPPRYGERNLPRGACAASAIRRRSSSRSTTGRGDGRPVRRSSRSPSTAPTTSSSSA